MKDRRLDGPAPGPDAPPHDAADAGGATPWALLAALAEPTRIRLLAALVEDAATPGALAARLGGKPGDLVRHLSVLEEAGWVRRRDAGDSPSYRLDLEPARAAIREAARTGRISGGGPGAPAVGIRRRFFDGDRLRAWPSRLRDREEVLEEVLRLLPERAAYREPELNGILGRIHPDFCLMRRELIDLRYLERRAGVYRLAPRGELALGRGSAAGREAGAAP